MIKLLYRENGQVNGNDRTGNRTGNDDNYQISEMFLQINPNSEKAMFMYLLSCICKRLKFIDVVGSDHVFTVRLKLNFAKKAPKLRSFQIMNKGHSFSKFQQKLY